MKVSIIICTYNRSKFLKSAIKSILSQKYSNWELLIIDDGSWFSSKEYIKRLNDNRIKYIYKEKTGLFDSMNYGLNRINGKYITFCDDDDILLPNKLSQQVKFLESFPNAAACFSDYLIKDNKSTKNIRLNGKDYNFFFNYLNESFLPIHSLLLRAEHFKTGIDSSLLRAADYDWLLRIAASNPFLYCPGAPVAVYVRHNENMTNEKSNLEVVIKIIKKHYVANKEKFTNNQQKIIEASILFREGKFNFWKHEKNKARDKFYNSFKKNPKQMQSLFFIPFTFFGEQVFNLLIPLYENLTGRIYIKDCS